MWTNSMLKENAKAALKNFYWIAVLASLIFSLLAGGGGGSTSSGGSSGTDTSDSSYYEEMFEDELFGGSASIAEEEATADGILAAAVGIAGTVVLVIIAIAFVYSFFVANIITVGHNKFYIDARQGDAKLGNLFANFRSGTYMATVKTMFVMNIKIFLWSLLFIIPGIIKTYEYFLVPYILADNPTIDRKRAFEISKQTMNGEKMNLFGLSLSFIGWFILGAITIIGTIFVNPYYYATLAEFYACMKQKALASGIAQYDELPDNNYQDFGGNDQFNSNQEYNPTSNDDANGFFDNNNNN